MEPYIYVRNGLIRGRLAFKRLEAFKLVMLRAVKKKLTLFCMLPATAALHKLALRFHGESLAVSSLFVFIWYLDNVVICNNLTNISCPEHGM